MEAGVTTTTPSFPSILDKPLNQLTEEDISQLTREDCRKFLKEKGMRRPSWNKSQAIQQVISLKALLESGDDSGAGALRKVLASHSPTPRPKNVAPASVNSADSANEDADESALYESKEPAQSAALGEIGCRPVEHDNKCFSPRSPCEANELGEQMTIFYCGKVNVYDGVPADKARALMHLAASPMELPQDNPHNVNPDLRAIVCYLQAVSDKQGVVPPTAINSLVTQPVKLSEYPQQIRDKGNIARDPDIDGQASRKVSVQRYLEKRKDRGRFFKSRKSSVQPSNAEMYSNDQTKTQNSNSLSSQSNTSSPTMSGLPNAFCSSGDDDLGKRFWNICLSECVTE